VPTLSRVAREKLVVVNASVVAAKLSELASRVARARSHCPATAVELASDADALDIVAFNLMLAVQTCLDIASHIIADEGWPAAVTLASAFGTLRDRGVLSASTAAALARAAGLRNVVAHGHAAVDVAVVHSAAKQGLADLEAFATETAAWMRTRTGASPGSH